MWIRLLFVYLQVVPCLAGAAGHDVHNPCTLEHLLAWEPKLGNFAFDITASNPLAKRLFKIGLQLIYNFDQPNARNAFKHALAVDATCAMCAWGLAHSYGPFLNHPIKDAQDLKLGFVAAQQASALLNQTPSGQHSLKEQIFIESMMLRYPQSSFKSSDQLESYRRYAKRLRELRTKADQGRLLKDPDLMVFDAEAIMVTMCDDNGYHFYIARGDDLPSIELPETKEASDLLRAALVITNRSHPYAQHLLIHSTEMSNAEAETAVQVAAQLQKNMAGLQNQHLQHMTSHTFFRTGHYREAVNGNVNAVHSDAAYLHHGLVPYGPGHNSAFLVCAALWGGEKAAAYRFAQVMQQIYVNAPARPDGPDGSKAWSYPMLVAVRFGDWDRVVQLDATPPSNFSLEWPYGFGVVRHFAMAIADIRLGRLLEAEAHIKQLNDLVPSVQATAQPDLMNLTFIANHTASAAAAGARGDWSEAVEMLKLAVDLEMAMPYNEPPDWLLPSRECYGQALLNAKRPGDAEKIFRSALYGYSFHAEPRCGWALHGLRQSLEEQEATQARLEEIQSLTLEIQRVWKHSDVPLTSACLHLAQESRPLFNFV
eukprot:TRINITY_DN40637_c0_g1_i1.p1 TRINITY_DN40637_c0_g1~~TRINITY_DN40637_c0_g1_i1.p1  ORF type:complete len:596 (-),score=107.47 TRINITY_DN40637_c0_g1_i1:319-2106(-)